MQTEQTERANRIMAALKAGKMTSRQIAEVEKVSKTTVAHYKKRIGLTKPKNTRGTKVSRMNQLVTNQFEAKTTKLTQFQSNTLMVTLPLAEVQKLKETIVTLAMRLASFTENK